MINQIIKRLKLGHKILIAGNGGLAAEAEHFAAELTGKYHNDVFLPCIALTSNSSQLTALANDIGYKNTFAHLVKVLGKPNDIFIGMTTSRAENILLACDAAREKGLYVVLLDEDELDGDGCAAKQEYAIKYLHKLARDIKDACCKSE